MEIKDHIVRFDIWCEKCKHKNKKETESPCNECLESPTNVNSKQPTLFEKPDK